MVSLCIQNFIRSSDGLWLLFFFQKIGKPAALLCHGFRQLSIACA